VRVRVNGTVYELDEVPKLAKYKKHTIEVVVDRVVIRPHNVDQELHGDGTDPDRTRLLDSVETALKLGEGIINVATVPSDPDEKPQETTFSEHLACPNCGFSTGEIEPRNFSFNSPQGACPACTGLGLVQEFDPEQIIPNPDLTLAEGAVQPWVRASQSASGYYFSILEALSSRYGFSTKVPVRELPRPRAS
jgi:excinuclease ABC subunit A